MRTTTILMVLTMVMFFTGAALAVDPPGLMNYQGVLRDADDNPLDGTYDMVFRFYDDADPGDPENEIFVDEHLASGTGAVTVTGGLFDVVLGSGDFYDGSGPGDHPHIYYVFGLHETVYLEVQVGAEILQPRMQVVSAPYAIHAAVLGGYTPSDFVNTGSEEQEKIGLLRALGGIDFGGGAHDDLTAGDVTGLTAGPGNYADFLHSHNYADNADTVDGKHASEFAEAAHAHSASDIIGPVSEASNADTVDGKHANEFIDTSFNPQIKPGPLVADASTTLYSYGVRGLGQEAGGLFVDSNESGVAVVGAGHFGVQAAGNDGGGYFSLFGSSAYATIASSDSGGRGVDAYGAAEGGYFHSDGSGVAHFAVGDRGVSGTGNESGGHFENGVDSNLLARLAFRDSGGAGFGILAHGPIGAEFWSTETSGVAILANDHKGILGYGEIAGGYFADTEGTSEAYIGYGDYGVEAYGDYTGGHFTAASGAQAYVGGYGSLEFGVAGWGNDAGGYFAQPDVFSARAQLGCRAPGSGKLLGIWATGNDGGGYFTDSTGSAEAYLGYVDSTTGFAYGIRAEGNDTAGYFENPDGAWVNVAHSELDGAQTWGIVAGGGTAGGRFYDADGGSGKAWLGTADKGIWAEGDGTAGAFENNAIPGSSAAANLATDWSGSRYGIVAWGPTNGGYFLASAATGRTYVGYGDRGLWAAGSFSGGTFSDTIPATGVWSDLAMILGDPPTSYKITGSGQVSFVQNHPREPDRGGVYSAPEGDETAVYTRGTARLVAGEARVTLGETFKWVTNPDVGLTAYLTPRGDCMGLYVEKLSTEEMTVRELGGGAGDVVFDYIVYGLRIGFEQSNVVQSKLREAPLAAPNLGEEFYAVRAAPEAITALGRFTRMTADVRGVAPEELDLSGATALREAIRASDWKQIGMEPIGNGAGGDPAAGAAPAGPTTGGAVDGGTGAAVDPTAGEEPERESLEPASPFTLFPVSEQVEVGDLLVLDGEQPGQLRRADRAGDPNVVGIVAEESWTVDGQLQAAVALYGLASVKVDASHGVILAGDLLATSPTPGHAGLALVPTPGTVIGKALEPLESGTGFIRILVMPR